jgi:uncharacterized protein YkwD
MSPIHRPAWIALAAVAFVALLATAISIAISTGGSGRDPHSAARDIVERANALRAAQGLSSLQVNSELTRASDAYALDLARGGTYSHTGDDGSTLDERAEAAGYDGWALLAENLAAGEGAPDATAVIAGWMRSDGHRQNLLSSRVDEIGVSCAASDGRYWCVAVFGAIMP